MISPSFFFFWNSENSQTAESMNIQCCCFAQQNCTKLLAVTHMHDYKIHLCAFSDICSSQIADVYMFGKGRIGFDQCQSIMARKSQTIFCLKASSIYGKKYLFFSLCQTCWIQAYLRRLPFATLIRLRLSIQKIKEY